MKVYETREVKDAFDVSSFFKKMKMQYGAKKTDIELLVSSDERNCERIVAVFRKDE